MSLQNPSKLIVATAAEERLAGAYAILRQVHFYLNQPAPLPRAQDDVRKAVREFCQDYETELRRTAHPIKTPST